MSHHSLGSSELTFEGTSIAYYKPNAFKSNALCEIPNATDGYGHANPGFPLVNVFTYISAGTNG